MANPAAAPGCRSRRRRLRIRRRWCRRAMAVGWSGSTWMRICRPTERCADDDAARHPPRCGCGRAAVVAHADRAPRGETDCATRGDAGGSTAANAARRRAAVACRARVHARRSRAPHSGTSIHRRRGAGAQAAAQGGDAAEPCGALRRDRFECRGWRARLHPLVELVPAADQRRLPVAPGWTSRPASRRASAALAGPRTYVHWKAGPPQRDDRRMNKLVLISVALVAALFLAVSAFAATKTLTVKMTGGNTETPKGDPNGKGTAKITLNTSTGRVCFKLTWSNIGNPVAAHIHKGK